MEREFRFNLQLAFGSGDRIPGEIADMLRVGKPGLPPAYVGGRPCRRQVSTTEP
jgi:hypothetical protein